MTASLSWYLASSLLGWLTFPLVFRLLPALTDRGYTLARAAGILLWGWLFWILASLGILRNDLGGVLFAFLLLLGLSAWSLMTDHWSLATGIKDWLSSNTRLILATELLFLASFAFLALVRAANPEAVGTEKPMELAFINAILRSPTLPPNDPWMSGYAISYYHFGYILAAMLARLTGASGNMAFNLMSALVFALAAVGSYGVLYNLLSVTVDRRQKTEDDTLSTVYRPPSTVIGLALLAPLFLLILSNFEGLLETFHSLGWFWPQQPITNLQSPISNFWTWLNIKDLVEAPTGTGWLPDRYLWWWRASRVVSDFDLVGNHQEVIDEFPAFSFVLGDLHPHILSLPFNMLGIGVALNIFLGGWRGIVNFFELKLRTTPRDFFFAALVLGGLAFLNTWDILPIAALIVGAYVLVRVRADGWSWSRLEDAFLLGIPLAVTAFLLYLPFYLGFSSQAGGILPNLINPTRGAHLWVMWGTLLIPLLAYLIWMTRDRETRPRYGTALAWTVGGILFLWAFSSLMGLAAQRVDPAFSAQYLASQNQPDAASFFQAAFARRLSYIGGLLTIASVFWLALSHLLGKQAVTEESTQVDTYTSTQVDTYTGTQVNTYTRASAQEDTQYAISRSIPVGRNTDHRSLITDHFVLLLILLASLLILLPDFIYLRDGFGYRINTVFKFYYQAWQLWAIAAAFASATLLRVPRGVGNVAWRLLLGLVLFAGLIYPVLAFLNKTNNFNPSNGFTLDASAHLNYYNPEDAAAIKYLQSAPMGVVAEAIGGSYSNYARISTYSGLPAVLGWPWHEYQWRGDWSAHGTREADIKTLYEVVNWDVAQSIIDRYQIRYIVVGNLERTTYDVSEAKFQQHLAVLFKAGNTVVYGVP